MIRELLMSDDDDTPGGGGPACPPNCGLVLFNAACAEGLASGKWEEFTEEERGCWNRTAKRLLQAHEKGSK